MLRLSDVNGERSLDVIADIIEPVCRIALDPKAGKFFQASPVKKGETEKDHAISHVRKNLPTLLKTRKAEIYEILGIISGEGADYVKNRNAAEVFSDCLTLMGDPEFRNLFFSAVPSQGTVSTGGSDDTLEAKPSVE